MLSTFELFVKINDGDELRSTITLIFIGPIEGDEDDDDDDNDDNDNDGDVSIGLGVELSLDVFSPLVEQIAVDGDKRF